MFANIRRQKWLWILIAGLTIIAFVFLFAPQQQVSGVGGDSTVGMIYGEPVTRSQHVEAYQEARLRYRLLGGSWPDENESSRMFFNEDREIRMRLLLIKKLEQLGIEADNRAIAHWIANSFKDQDGQFKFENYERFITDHLRPKGYSEKHLRRFVEHELGVQHLVAMFGLPGKLLPPQAAEEQYRRENEQVKAKAVFFSSTNYLAQITLDPAAVGAFFTNQSFRYRIPEQAQVSYLRFDATNYMAQADEKLAANADLSGMIDQIYQQRGPAYYQGLAVDDAKARIQDEIRQELALIEARRRANDIADRLLDLEPAEPGNLAKVAAEHGFEVNETSFFTQFQGPAEFEAPESFARTAFSLTPAEPFPPQPIVGTATVYILEYKARKPSELPPFETVQEQVTRDFRQSRALELARQSGREFHATLTNALATGESIEAVAEKAGVPVVDIPLFSRQTTSLPGSNLNADLSSIKNVAFALTPGKAGEFTPARDGGFVLQLIERVPVEDAQVESELAEFIERTRQSGQYRAFDDWLRAETERAQIILPGSSKEDES